MNVVNRPGVAGADLQSGQSLSDSSFSSESSRHCQSQTRRAEILREWLPPACVTCHMFQVRCQVSGVRCRMSGVKCHL